MKVIYVIKKINNIEKEIELRKCKHWILRIPVFLVFHEEYERKFKYVDIFISKIYTSNKDYEKVHFIVKWFTIPKKIFKLMFATPSIIYF